MNKSNMKNMIVLKNLPSNLIEEAIVILKENQRIKKLNLVPQEKNIEDSIDEDNYIIKEAEFVISNYIRESEKVKENKEEIINKKYKKLRIISYGLAIMCWIELVCILV